MLFGIRFPTNTTRLTVFVTLSRGRGSTTKGKEVDFKTSSNMELGKNFSAKIIKGEGNIAIQSDLTGLNN
ncbi:hypothetical protein D1164_18515 [Mariniphaga sediminis]|uniref:Uncharacterized protein n=1 Tax=Mariniphaga sediminis TaxID=1628158 RepID=A0A399CXR3_9BACT|nr:hypothetical protein D1164_18515 [Mariniphaga sediminis]